MCYLGGALATFRLNAPRFASGTLAAKKEDDVLDVEYVERVLDMRSSRLESAAQSLRDLDASLRAVNDEVFGDDAPVILLEPVLLG